MTMAIMVTVDMIASGRSGAPPPDYGKSHQNSQMLRNASVWRVFVGKDAERRVKPMVAEPSSVSTGPHKDPARHGRTFPRLS
jgi:hypothetical protein